jgi:hypothetical protein
VDPVTAAVAVGVMTSLAHWADDRPLTMSTWVGVAAVAVGLTVINGINERVGSAFGILVVSGVAFAHAPIIMRKVNL